MPPVLALIPAILGAVGIGEGIHSLTSRPGSSAAAAPNPQQVQADALKTRSTQEAALSQQLPGIQERTGGALSPEAWLQMAEILSGQAGNPGIGGASGDLLQKLKAMVSGGGGGYNVTAGSGGNPSGSPGLTPSGSSFG